MTLHYGFHQGDWDAAKSEAVKIMVERARLRGMIAYSDLLAKLTRISLAPHDPRVYYFLGEISSDENAAGRGMLTVIVVHKHGDMQPGPGFFELAGQLGRDTTDIVACWVEELHRVHAVWSRR